MFALLLITLSWLDGGRPAPIQKPRPAPVEPDKPNHDFHAPDPVPEPIKNTNVWHADAQGFWWVFNQGKRYGDMNPEIVRPYGYPINID